MLNNQPQGGFLMRRPTVDVPVARRNDWGNVARRNDWGNHVFNWFSQPANSPPRARSDNFGFNWNSQPANTRPRAGQYYQPMQQRWW